MRRCMKCGTCMDDDYIFCPRCGADASVSSQQINSADRSDPDIVVEKNFLDSLNGMFRAESIVWRISGIIMLVICVLGLITELDEFSAGMADLFKTVWYLTFYAVLYLPVGIVDLVMASRTARYINTLYTDARPAVKRCGSVGMIVLGALFNGVAMVFIIIKFVKVKSNAALIDRITARQQGFNAENRQQ